MKHPDLAPGADPALAKLVAQVKAHPFKKPVRKPTRTPEAMSAFAKGWRAKWQAAGGHVTNIVYTPTAWQAVQDQAGPSRYKGTISRAACTLIERGALVDERTISMAQKILEAYPDMGTIEVAIEVSVAHLLAKITEDQSYTISLPA